MSKDLLDTFKAKDFRTQGHELIDLLADYLEAVQSSADAVVLPWQEPQDNYDFWKNYQFQSPASFFEDVLKASMHLHHPHYIGHQVSPALPASALSGLLTSFLKNGSGVYEMAPVGGVIERIVAEELAHYIGYDKTAAGIMTSGGTLANLTALLTARQEMGSGDIWNDGLSENLDLAIMVSGESHYCIDRAVRIMGLGTAGIVKIPLGENFRVNPDALEETYQKASAAGKRIFAIVGNACGTATGSHDDLQALARFAKAKGIWFHADAAHGGAALFSKKYQHLLAGIDQADSVVIDCHKMMLTAGLATALVYKEGKKSYRTFRMKAQYLFEETESLDWSNNAKRTFECTKFMTALNTYMAIKQYGAELFESYVDQTYDLARAFYQVLKADPDFETIHEPESNIVCFRYHRPDLSAEQLQVLNRSIRERIIQSGKFYLVQTTIEGRLYLRVSIMNPHTDLRILQNLLAEIKQVLAVDI